MFLKSKYFSEISAEYTKDETIEFMNLICDELSDRINILKISIRNNDYQEVEYIAHKIVSGLDTIGQSEIAILARKIEDNAREDKIEKKEGKNLISNINKLIEEIKTIHE